MDSTPKLPEPLLEAIKAKRLVLFIGAGLSCSVGLGGWEDLKKELIKEFRPKKSERDPDALRAHLSESKDYYKVFKQIREHDGDTYLDTLKKFLTVPPEAPPKFKRLLGHLMNLNPISIVTLNIDSLLLDHNPYPDGRRALRFCKECFPWELPDKRVFCFHGVEDHRGGNSIGWVFDDRELEGLYSHPTAQRFLYGLFSGAYTVLFIGFSFSDDLLLNHAKLPTEAKQEWQDGKRVFHYGLIASGNDGLKRKMGEYGIAPLEYEYIEAAGTPNERHKNFEKTLEAWGGLFVKGETVSAQSNDIPEEGPSL